MTDSWTGCSIHYRNTGFERTIIFVLEPKVPVAGRLGTLSLHMFGQRCMLPRTTELECPAYNDIFDNCPWKRGDSFSLSRSFDGIIKEILFNGNELKLNRKQQIVKYFWFFEYLRTKHPKG